MSACEAAGYQFGASGSGVRGKAGTPGFWAPEMLYYERDGRGRRYGPAADWWSFGCLTYALLTARGPFTVIGGDTGDDNAATLDREPDLSAPALSPAAVSLLRGLLQKDPRDRLGCGTSGADEIMAHPFFAGVDWVAMAHKQLPPVFRPTVNVLQSTKVVRSWSEKDRAALAAVTVSGADHARFKGVPFVSQKALYREVIQNLALTEYAAEVATATGGAGTAATAAATAAAARRAATPPPTRRLPAAGSTSTPTRGGKPGGAMAPSSPVLLASRPAGGTPITSPDAAAAPSTPPSGTPSRPSRRVALPAGTNMGAWLRYSPSRASHASPSHLAATDGGGGRCTIM